jgi:dTDP-4-dehydrorhamnose 3,5-epimerase-like enzyme|tara:strand:+ start:648 stop:1085 length:438 start_codon:yes stop_codon:yes gene_type:complete
MNPKLINGNRIYDNRGSLRFSNELDLKNIKRFYTVHNYNKNFIRAWHGHMNEDKYIGCIKGTFQVSAVKIDNVKKPNKKNKIHNFFLNESDSNFVHISKGFANGSMSLEENSELLIFSTSSIKESLKDDIRYDVKYWNPWQISQR